MTVVIVSVATTSELVALVIELVPQFPVPPVEAAVTVKLVEPAGVAPVVVIVSVDVVAPLVTVVGLNAAVAPVGAVQLIVRGAEVQTGPPVHVVLIVYVAEEPGATGFGACAPTVVAVIV